MLHIKTALPEALNNFCVTVILDGGMWAQKKGNFKMNRDRFFI